MQHIEVLIFGSKEPIQINDIQHCLAASFDTEVSEESIRMSIEKLMKKYEDDQFTFQIYWIGNGYLFLTKPAYKGVLSVFLKEKGSKKLSHSALETLAIIAYKQPVTKLEIEQIRGVNCDYTLHKLLEKELILIKGKAETVGRPLLYTTSDKFMDFLGIGSLSELPQLKDFIPTENTIGEEVNHE